MYYRRSFIEWLADFCEGAGKVLAGYMFCVGYLGLWFYLLVLWFKGVI